MVGCSGGGRRVEDAVDRALLRTLTLKKKKKKSYLGRIQTSIHVPITNSPPDSDLLGRARRDLRTNELHRLSWPGSSQPEFYLNPCA